MKALLVGAGAVGQVYGYYLQKGGAEISFYVREKHAAEAREGYALYPLSRRRPREAPVRFKDYGVLTRLEEVSGTKWDQVYLCMSSTGLRGDWLAPFTRAIGDATLITLQPGLRDRDEILKSFPAERLVSGLIPIISYHAPLEGEKVPEPGMAFWIPPFQPGPFSGPEDRVEGVVRALRAGGFPAKRSANVPLDTAYGGMVLSMIISSLEGAGWSFRAFRDRARLQEAAAAIREGLAIVEQSVGGPAPAALRLIRPGALSAITRLAPCFVPLDLETYLKAHFTKVGDQTRLGVGELIRIAARKGQPHSAILALEKRVNPGFKI